MPRRTVPGAEVAVLSWGLWQTRYGGDRSVIGQTVTLDRRAHTVFGVMPAGFEFPLRGPQSNSHPARIWLPLAFTDRQKENRGDQFLYSVIARLRPGVSLDAARSELDLLAAGINASYPPVLKRANFSIRISAVPLREEIAGRAERPLLLLFGAVGLVLLVTCANVANLVLSRAVSRGREIAVRMALGSSRGRLLQVLLTETAMLSTAGGALGLLLSRVIIGVVPAVVTEQLPVAEELSIDVRVLMFTAGLAIATAIAMALIPLITVDRRAAAPALQESASRTTPGRRRHRVQAGLVGSTVMLAFVLLVSAGLLIRSFSALLSTDAGFDPDRVLTASLTLPRLATRRRRACARSMRRSSLAPRPCGESARRRWRPTCRWNTTNAARSLPKAWTIRVDCHSVRICRGSTGPTSKRSGSD